MSNTPPTQPFSWIMCSDCGITFAVPTPRYELGLLRDGRNVWCPNGHEGFSPVRHKFDTGQIVHHVTYGKGYVQSHKANGRYEIRCGGLWVDAAEGDLR